MTKWRQRIAALAATTLSIVALASFPTPAAKADPGCIDGGVYVLWARGSGAGFDAEEAKAFKNHVYYALNALGVTRHEWAELGNLDNDFSNPVEADEYPAIAVDNWNLVNVFNGQYSNSVRIGADELIRHLNQRYAGGRCGNESLILGGYSQVADVIGLGIERGVYVSLSDEAKYRLGFVEV